VVAAPSILVVNGPNLNMLGTREPEVYGRQTLADVDAMCRQHAECLGLIVTCRQSNHEGELVDWVQAARGAHDALIVNAGAYTHTSIALRDALLATELPVVEVHLSNLFRREAFRHQSYISDIAIGLISGFGAAGYRMALDALAQRLVPQEAA
jgi:3-dehydroquinate dehydratase-2